MSRLELMAEPHVTAVRRVEVITGASGRRRWSDDEKARVVEETLQPDAVVSAIARRHGLTPQQVFTWRRAMRRTSTASDGPASPAFVPAIVDAAESAAPDVKTIARPPVIELDIDGDSVWIWGGAEAAVVAAIIRALKAPR